MLVSCALSDEKDTAIWIWEKSGIFIVKSMYDHLLCNETYNPNTKLWKSKTPLKVKIFMWLVQQNAIQTKDNLIKRNCMVTQDVIFVKQMRTQTICSLIVQ
jgi:hypothetical protein